MLLIMTKDLMYYALVYFCLFHHKKVLFVIYLFRVILPVLALLFGNCPLTSKLRSYFAFLQKLPSLKMFCKKECSWRFWHQCCSFFFRFQCRFFSCVICKIFEGTYFENICHLPMTASVSLNSTLLTYLLTNSPAYQFLQLIQQFKVAATSTNPDMAAVFHVLLYGRFMEIHSNLRRKKLHRTNQGSYFLGGSFSDRGNVRAPIQFGRESQPQHLKIQFFLKNRPIHFLVKQNQLSFSSLEINQPLPAPIHSVSQI